MSRLLTDGAELTAPLGAVPAVDATAGNLTAVTSPVWLNGRAYKYDAAAGNVQTYASWNIVGVTARAYYMRARWQWHTFPTATTVFMRIDGTSGGTAYVSVRVTTAGKLQLWNQTGTPAQIGSDSSTLNLDQYYRVELLYNNNGASSTVELLLDGVAVVASQTVNLGTAAAPGFWRYGYITSTPGANNLTYVDDIALNDDQGSVQNGYPGNTHCVLCYATTDVANSNWTGGAGGTSNLAQALGNVPPTGVAAASETDPSQIKTANASTPAYEADCISYSAAGIGPLDTIVSVQPFANTSKEVSTGTRSGRVFLTSNPNVGDPGANNLVYGTVAAAWSSGWKSEGGTVTGSPSVNIGSGPRVKLNKTDVGTRFNDVDSLGVLVEYTSAPQPPLRWALPPALLAM